METNFSIDGPFIHALVAMLQLLDEHHQFGSSAPPIWEFISGTFAELPNWWCSSSSCSVATNACIKVLSTEKCSPYTDFSPKKNFFMGAVYIEGSGSLQSKIILF